MCRQSAGPFLSPLGHTWVRLLSILSPGFGDSLYQWQDLRGGPGLDEAPVLHQQHYVSLLQVLGAVGAEQPRGVAQRSQDALVQQVAGHICIHGGQGVIEEIELLLLVDGASKGDAGPLSPAEGHALLPHLCLVSCRQDAEVIVEGAGL